MPSNAERPIQLQSKHINPTARECMIASLMEHHQKQLNALMPGTYDEWCSTRKMYKLVDITTGRVVMQGKPAFWIWMQQAV